MDNIHEKKLFNPRIAMHIRISHQSAVANAKQNSNKLMVNLIRLLHDKKPNRNANVEKKARQ